VSVFWQFGDPASGNSNTTTVQNPVHLFSGNGTYVIKLIKNYNCYSDTVIKTLQVSENLPLLNVQTSATVCLGNSLQLSASGANSYSWSTGQSGSSISITPSSSMNISVVGTSTSNNCSASKTIAIAVSKCTDVPDYSVNSQIQLYPNPTEDIFTLSCNSAFKYVLVNSFGIVLRSESKFSDSCIVDVSDLAAGVYFVRCEFKNHQTKAFKILKN
jgi:PKD repeat protein